MQLVQINPKDQKALRRFIDCPYELYKGHPFWVPPLRSSLEKTLREGSGMQLSGGPHALFILEDGGRAAGRILVGINQVKNAQRHQNQGYFSLFECEDDPEKARQLMDGAARWWAVRQVDLVTGPVSPTNGDDYRGILVEGFDQMPAINTTYTMPYYPRLLESLGYSKYLDFYAYSLKFDPAEIDRVNRIVAYGRKKINLDIQGLCMKKIGADIHAIHQVLTEAMQPFWEHLEIPTYEQIKAEFDSSRKLLDPDLILIARIDGVPAGFVAGMPDYNQVLRHIRGRLTPLSALKFLYYRPRIRRVRMFMQFVVPKYQRTVVTAALYAELYRRYQKHGYTDMEASTMAEFNHAALSAMKGVGFVTNRVYRIYQKSMHPAENEL
jgi:hypothetical protein